MFLALIVYFKSVSDFVIISVFNGKYDILINAIVFEYHTKKVIMEKEHLISMSSRLAKLIPRSRKAS